MSTEETPGECPEGPGPSDPAPKAVTKKPSSKTTKMKKPAASQEVQCESESDAAAATAVTGPVADEATDAPAVLEPSPKATAKPKAKGKAAGKAKAKVAASKPAAKSKASARPTPPIDDSGQLVGNLPSWYWYIVAGFWNIFYRLPCYIPSLPAFHQLVFCNRYSKSYQKSFQRVLLQKFERLRSES